MTPDRNTATNSYTSMAVPRSPGTTGSQLRKETLNRILPSLEFPAISYAEFLTLPESARLELLTRNRITNTDTYNRTMAELAEKEKTPLALKAGLSDGTALIDFDHAVYTLQLRRAPHGFLIATGIEDLAEELSLLKISQNELNFAKEYYKHTSVPFANEKMWDWIVHKNGGTLPFEMRGLRDGEVVAPGDPVLTISGPSELIAHFEHVIHRVYYGMLVAAQAHVLADIVEDPNRFIEVGLRGAITDEQHLKALKAIAVGGGFKLTSSDSGMGAFGMIDVGTIGHRFVQRFPSVECAFRFAIENLSRVTLLVDLLDSYEGLDLTLRLKQEYREFVKKPICARLDSGDLLDQAQFYLRKAIPLGFTDPDRDMIAIEGMESLQELQQIEEALRAEFGAEIIKQLVFYGAGSLLSSDRVSRSDASSGFKIDMYTDSASGKLTPTMKLSNSPGKESLPGVPELFQMDTERIIGQQGEATGKTLFEPLLFRDGTCAEKTSLEKARLRVAKSWASIRFTEENGKQVAVRSKRSRQTIQLGQEVLKRYGRG